MIYQPVTIDEFVEGAVAAGMAREEAEPLGVVFEQIFDGRNAYTTDTVERVLGRPAGDFATFVCRAAASLSGVLHLAFGAIGFLALAVAAFVIATWCVRRHEARWALYFRVSGALIIVGFLTGAALATETLGVVALWVAVVVGWVWLAATSIHLYRTVPHPDPHLPRTT